MIQKLENGATHMTLGLGTCYHGIMTSQSEGKTIPTGICFTNSKEGGLPTDVIIKIANEKGVASYMKAMLSFLEFASTGQNKDVDEMIRKVKVVLDEYMPEDNVSS